VQYLGLFFQFAVHFDYDAKLHIGAVSIAIGQKGLRQVKTGSFQVWRGAGSDHGLQFLNTPGTIVRHQQTDR
jgi:hypothetical protein